MTLSISSLLHCPFAILALASPLLTHVVSWDSPDHTNTSVQDSQFETHTNINLDLLDSYDGDPSVGRHLSISAETMPQSATSGHTTTHPAKAVGGVKQRHIPRLIGGVHTIALLLLLAFVYNRLAGTKEPVRDVSAVPPPGDTPASQDLDDLEKLSSAGNSLCELLGTCRGELVQRLSRQTQALKDELAREGRISKTFGGLEDTVDTLIAHVLDHMERTATEASKKAAAARGRAKRLYDIAEIRLYEVTQADAMLAQRMAADVEKRKASIKGLLKGVQKAADMRVTNVKEVVQQLEAILAHAVPIQRESDRISTTTGKLKTWYRRTSQMCTEMARQEATNLRHCMNYASQDLPIGLMSEKAARALSGKEELWTRLIEIQMDAPTVAYLETVSDPVVALEEVEKLKAAKRETERVAGAILNGIKKHLADQGEPAGITGIYQSSTKSLEYFRRQAVIASSAARWQSEIAISLVDSSPSENGMHNNVSAFFTMARDHAQKVSRCSRDAAAAAIEAAHVKTLTDTHALAMQARKFQLEASYQNTQVLRSMLARATWERLSHEARAALREIADAADAVAAVGKDSGYSEAKAIRGQADIIEREFYESTDLIAATGCVVQLNELMNQAWQTQDKLRNESTS